MREGRMRKTMIAFAVVLGAVGCKTVDVSLPIPIRLSETVTILSPVAAFSGSAVISGQRLWDGISEHTEAPEDALVELESAVFVVSRNDCAENTVIQSGDLRIGLGAQLDSLASVEDINLTDVLGDTLRVHLYSGGVATLNTFAGSVLAGGNDSLRVELDGVTTPSPPTEILDFDVDIIVTFTVVIVREMTTIGF
jgi:hypothetical protein